MFSLENYTLNLSKTMSEFPKEAIVHYRASYLPSAPDAALEIGSESIKAIVDGSVCHHSHTLSQIVANYSHVIRRTFPSIAPNEVVIICGKLHYNVWAERYLFLPYIERRMFDARCHSLQRYQRLIFDWDDMSTSSGHGCILHNCSEAWRPLHVMTKLRIDKHISMLAPDEEPEIEGMIWFPDGDEEMPIVVSRLSTWERDIGEDSGTG